MLTICSFLQGMLHFVKCMMVKVTKRMYRHAAVLTTGFAVVTVVALTSTGFGGGGKNALTVFAETRADIEAEEEEPEEIETNTEAKIQIDLTDSRHQGQLVVGELLARDLQQKEQNQIEAKAEVEKIKQEIQMEAEAKAEAEAKKASSVVAYSEQDYQVLLRIVQAEAGICDDKGKILVANVILNRVRNREFPNNITDVVYQKSQFSPVSNGSINTAKITSQTVDCVNRALAGEDHSQGAMYFMYRGGSRARAISWFDKRLTFLFQHERHEFFK